MGKLSNLHVDAMHVEDKICHEQPLDLYDINIIKSFVRINKLINDEPAINLSNIEVAKKEFIKIIREIKLWTIIN